MSAVAIERVLTQWTAEVLGRTVDTDICRGGIPAGKKNFVSVMLGGEIPDSRIGPRTWNLQILGRFVSRDDALEMLDRLAGSVPFYDLETGGVRIVSLVPRGGGEPYPAGGNGALGWNASANFEVSALLTNPDR